MREAVIVSTARTPIGKAYRGAFNDTQAQTLGGHVIAQAVTRAGVDAGEIDDVVMGAAMQQGSTGYNVARQCALRAGLPTTRRRHVGRPAMRLRPDGHRDRRQADRRRRHAASTVGGGLELISLVQNDKMNRYRAQDPWLVEHRDDVYMIDARDRRDRRVQRYKIPRERQDEYALQSQQRTAAAQAAGRFDAEIVPLPSVMKVADKATGAISDKPVTLKQDEGVAPTPRSPASPR